MRLRPGLLVACTALAALLAACGDGSGDAPLDAGPGPVDGQPPSDAQPLPSCDMRMSVAPAMPRAPTDLVITGEIFSVSVTGIQSFDWDVRFENEFLEPVVAPDGRQITIAAAQAGTYELRLLGSMGGYTCTDAFQRVVVAPADATTVSYRLRFVPGPGHSAVTHERTDTMIAGLDYDLGRITLPSGIPVSGTILTADGAPLPAYVRATRGDAVPVESFAGASGTFPMRLEGLSYDLLVVPGDPAQAPARFPIQATAAPWTLTLPPAVTVSGTVRGPVASEPLFEARVAVRVDGAPAAVAITDEQGAFSLPVRAGAVAELLVVPADTALPWLELGPSSELAAALATGGALDIAYTAGLTAHQVAPTALDTGGAALGGVRATWIARGVTAPAGAPAGTARAGDGPELALTGTARVTAVARPDGAWPAVTLPEAVYDVVLEPPDGSAGNAGGVVVRVVDLAADPGVDTLALAEPALVRGTVVDGGGGALSNIRVTARPLDLLAHSPAAGDAATTDANGAFTLGLAPDTAYELLADSTDRRHGRARISVTAPAAGQSLELAPTSLPAASRLSGEVALLDGAGAGGITVLLTCLGCDDPAPLAEAVTSGSGAFVLAVPHPAGTP